jgi:hypothetical protein
LKKLKTKKITKISDKNSGKTDKITGENFALSAKREQVQPFLKRDLFVYPAIFLFVLILFLIVLLPAKSKTIGFTVSHQDTVILTFTHEKAQPITLNPEYENLVEIEKIDQGYKVKIYTSLDKIGYNTIVFDQEKRTAKVTDSNCSERKDCFHTPAISDNGTIYCSPHKLLIKPIGNVADTPITG